MALKIPQTITDANLIVEGQGYLGVCKELKLPTIEREIANVETAGLTRPVDLGLFKELKAEFTIKQVDSKIINLFVTEEYKDRPLILKSSIHEGTSAIPVVVTLKGMVTKIEEPTLSAKQEVERKVEFACTYYSLDIQGKTAIVMDTENFVARINGKDLLEQVKVNLL